MNIGRTGFVAVGAALLTAVAGNCFGGDFGYEVEYVEGDGQAFADTGFVCDRSAWDYRVDAEFANDGTYGGANARLEFMSLEGRGHRTLFRVVCEKDVRTLYLDGHCEYSSDPWGAQQTNNAIMVFNFGRGPRPGDRRSQSGKVYGFELYHDGTLVQRLVPGVDKAGVACFRDELSGKLLYSLGKSPFKAGPKLGPKGRPPLVPWSDEVKPPAVVDIDCGRQLFVDDWVVGATNGVVRHWNAPTKIEDPILTPTSEKGGRVGGCTVATDGGLWWDPKIRKFRLWYETDWCGTLRYAESADGLRWEFPDLGVVKGSNQLFAKQTVDSWSVFPDYAAKDPYACWNLFVSDEGCHSLKDTFFTSADGRHFTELGVRGASGDRSTMYYDPFRGKWIFSLRCYWSGRSRRYVDSPVFYDAKAKYSSGSAERWRELPHGNLYSFAAAPYESLMVGAMELLGDVPWIKHKGHCDNLACADAGLPKQTRLQFSFSRDGRHYEQGGEACAIRPSGWGSGKWDTGYLSAIGGICVIRDEKLWIYYSALRGDASRSTDDGIPDSNDNGLYYNGSIGAATLRRDGFAGMVADGRGSLTTRPLKFTGKRLFVNAECRFGEVTAEVLDASGQPYAGFTTNDCAQLQFADTTKRELVFKGGDLAKFGDQKASVRFHLHCATLYSFWISPSERGESRGYVAAGGPAYEGLRDMGGAL